MHEERDEIDDEIAALICAIVARNGAAVVAAASMLGMTGLMAEGLSTKHRFKLASRARDLADWLEEPELVR